MFQNVLKNENPMNNRLPITVKVLKILTNIIQPNQNQKYLKSTSMRKQILMLTMKQVGLKMKAEIGYVAMKIIV
jgi:hypothetical protein